MSLPPPDKPAKPSPGPGRQTLTYVPDGPLGGTFTCTQCGAQAWQPDLLDHAPGCPYRPAAPSGSGGHEPPPP